MSFQSNTILVALELSNSVWLVSTRLAGAQKSRMHRISAGDTTALLALFDRLRASQRPSEDPAPIACCFEAGRDGFWIQRLLTGHGIATYVVEPTSILVNRRAKRAKPIVSMLRGYCVCSPPIWLATVRSAAWSRCPHLKRKTASVFIVSASILCRTGHG